MGFENILRDIPVKINTNYYKYEELNTKFNLPNFGEGIAHIFDYPGFGMKVMRVTCIGLGDNYLYPIKVLSPI